MRRTTVLLPDALHEKFRREAFRSHVSMAELIRARLEGKPQTGRSPRDPLAKVEGVIRNGNLSANIEETLYGR